MPSGTIARLLIDKGFGFIRDEGVIEHFFHLSSVRGAVFELLREGQRVDFTVAYPERARQMQIELAELIASAPKPGDAGPARAVDSETRRALESLGYLE